MEKREQGILLLSVFCILLLQFLLYQKAFLLHGIATIWQNIPSQLLAKYFQDITILEVIYQIGSLPFFYGIYAIYTTVFGERMSREFTLLLALTLSMVLLLWLKFIQIAVGLAYLGVVMSILFAQFTKVTTQYIEKTTFWYVKPGLYLILIPLFLLANVYPALLFGRQTLYTSFSPGTLEAMEWIRQHTEEDATIMATDTEGHLITGLANRKNVLDNNFLFIPDAEQRYAAMLEIYTTTDKRRAIQLLNAYNVTYLLFSPTAQEKFHALSLPYYDPYCLKPEYYEAIKIYKVQCVVE
ncbi:hypothetical protein HYS48_02630 [Candidatus Woesearchaeota archaeon]|nr:hypothetical protein [Candidatus Woesearchaeota archaeon]